PQPSSRARPVPPILNDRFNWLHAGSLARFRLPATDSRPQSSPRRLLHDHEGPASATDSNSPSEPPLPTEPRRISQYFEPRDPGSIHFQPAAPRIRTGRHEPQLGT